MINEQKKAWGVAPSVIRQLFAYGLQRKAEIGNDKVFDFSIGNPSVPAPEAIKDAVIKLMDEPSLALHGYTPASGDPRARKAVADSLARRYGIDADPELVCMTAGAAPGLTISLAALTNPGDDVIVIAPYFPEYKVYIEQAGCTCVEVLAREGDFQIDVDAIAAAITPKTSAVFVNSPNNPVGAIYTRENLEAFSAMLMAKAEESGHQIFVISDEPYRELSYGYEVCYMPDIYRDTVVCYSYSKAWSLPGERIGYIYVSERMEGAKDAFDAISGAARVLGFICASSLWQRVVAECIDEPADTTVYAANREALMEGLGEIGYEFMEPQGAFYLWVKALEPDANAFSERAKQFELLLVPSDSFGCEGWVRIGYCVDHDTIVNAMPAFRALYESYQ